MRVNVDDQFLGDSRLLYLNKMIGEPLVATAGRFVFLWMYCSYKRTDVLTARQININTHWANENQRTFNELLTESDLAEKVGEDAYRIKGVAERIAWIAQKSIAGKKSAEVKRLRKFQQTLNENQQTANENQPPTPTPTPTPTLNKIYIVSDFEKELAKRWLLFTKETLPKNRSTVDQYAQAIGKIKKRMGFDDAKMEEIFQFIRTDEFWVNVAKSPVTLLKKSKTNDLLKIENVVTSMSKQKPKVKEMELEVLNLEAMLK